MLIWGSYPRTAGFDPRVRYLAMRPLWIALTLLHLAAAVRAVQFYLR